MSAQICPRCQVRHFIWWIDEELSPFTQWVCGNCHYTAEENEKRIADCSHCAANASLSLMNDDTGPKRWCSACGLFEATSETFSE